MVLVVPLAYGGHGADESAKKPTPMREFLIHTAVSSDFLFWAMSKLARDTRPHAERVTQLYLLALSRRPTAAETAAMVGYVEKRGGTRAAYEDVIWAVINTREFLFNH